MGRIEMIGGRPQARGRGVASTLVAAALDVFWRRRVVAVELDVDADNRRATSLYRRFGFTKTGEALSFGKATRAQAPFRSSANE